MSHAYLMTGIEIMGQGSLRNFYRALIDEKVLCDLIISHSGGVDDKRARPTIMELGRRLQENGVSSYSLQNGGEIGFNGDTKTANPLRDPEVDFLESVLKDSFAITLSSS